MDAQKAVGTPTTAAAAIQHLFTQGEETSARFDAMEAKLNANSADLADVKTEIADMKSLLVTITAQLAAMGPAAPAPTPSTTTPLPSSTIPTPLSRGFLDGIGGENPKKILAGFPLNLEGDWTKKIPVLKNRNGDSIEFTGDITLVHPESYYESIKSKTQRANVDKPPFGNKFKSMTDWIVWLKALSYYVDAGGNADILSLLGNNENIKAFCKTMKIERDDIGMMTMKEIIIVTLFECWRPNEYDTVIRNLAKLKLSFYGYPKLMANVYAYTSTLLETLEGRSFSLFIVNDHIFPNWAEAFTKVKGKLQDEIERNNIKSYKDLCNWLEKFSQEAADAYESGLAGIVNPSETRPKKDNKIATVGAGANAGTTIRSAKGFPPEAWKCPVCALPYTSNKDADVKLFQTHGYPTSYDGSKVQCQVSNKTELDKWIALRQARVKLEKDKKAKKSNE
jgi:hypothetical protein